MWLSPVRCDGSNTLAGYDSAMVIDYDDAQEAHLVEPLDEVFNEESN